MAQLFNDQRPVIVKHSSVIVKVAQLFSKLAQLFNDHRLLIVKHSPLIVKLAQLFGNFTLQLSFVQATAISLPCVG